MSSKPDSLYENQRLRWFIYTTALIWTLVILGLGVVGVQQTQQDTWELALREARANFNKDQAFRFWAAHHGGVYVPITDRTPPNPKLSHIIERDISTPSGIKLTLMNPAYMVRQLSEGFSDLYGIKSHITSLKLMREENKPDDWERQALLLFEQGVKEVAEYAERNGKPHLRLMQPMITREKCLKCHDFQGYKVGDIRGGVSVAVPMESYLSKERGEIVTNSLSFLVLWLVGIAGIAIAGYRLLNEDRERSVAELKLRNQEQSLRHANQDLAQFAAVASHQIQEPLRLIGSYTGLIRRRYKDKLDKAGNEYIEYAVGSAERLQNLINDLLTYSHIGSIEPGQHVTESGKVLEGILESINTEAEIHREAMPLVNVDPEHLRRLFRYLLDNALEYSDDELPRIHVSAELEDAMWHFQVRDNGIGIAREHRQRIFNLFERLHNQAERAGTGAGLALSKRIVELYGGRIWVTSQLGEGSIFHFTLPGTQKSLE